MRNFLLILLGIALIGFMARVYKVDAVPVGLSNDEISIAYNAFSIWETGRDEYGIQMPASFKSHNTYKAPLYIYLAAPSIALFGNNEFALRLPSVLLGSLTILLLGLFVWQLFRREYLAFISASILALSPWHIYTSRIGLESNIALFCLMGGVVLLMHFIQNKKLWALLSAVVFFVLSIYGYHTEWIFTPLLLLLIAYIYRSSGIFSSSSKKKIFIAIILGIVLLIPIGFDYFHNLGTTARANTEFFLNDYRLHSLLTKYAGGNILLSILVSFLFWTASYLQYFSIPYLFFSGLSIFFDYSVMKFGLFLFVLIPFFVVGLFQLRHLTSKIRWLIIGWLLIGPLVPSITLGGANLVRNLVSIIPLIIIISLGVEKLIFMGKYLPFKLFSFAGALLLSFGFFYYSYLTIFPYYMAENWSYGFKEITVYVTEHEGEYDKIVIDPQYGVENNNLVGVPSLFVLYFGGYDPTHYLAEKKDSDGLLQFGKYEFRNVKWPSENISGKTLYVVGTFSKPVEGQKVEKLKSISLPTGKESFVFYRSTN